MDVAILFIVLFATILIGVPLFLSIGITSLVYLIFFTNVPFIIMVQRVFAGSYSFTMMSAPLFILAALFMDQAGISERIMRLSEVVVGRLKGGLGAVNVVASMLFAGISGTAQADTAAVGGLMIPAMIEKGYDPSYAAAVTAASSTIGIIIPPSTPMIYYGVLTGLSISSLFIAGIIPGIIIGLLMIGINTLISYRRDYERSTEKYSLLERLKVIAYAWPPLGMIVIILGGIMGGLFTPTEAAAVATIYAFIVGMFITRKIKVRHLSKIVRDAGIMTGSVMIIIAISDLLGWVITNAKIPASIVGPMTEAFSGSPALFMWMVSFILIVAGTFLHGTAMLVVVVPLFLPTVASLGINEFQFAMIVILCWGIGQQTPPVGSALYVCCQLADVDMVQITKENLPYIGALILSLGLVIHIPAIVTFLPSLIR